MAGNLALAFASVAVCLLLVETSVRLFYPRYQYAAESNFERDPDRIFVRQKGSTYERVHPDSGEAHTVNHNNLAARHHRDIEERDLRAAVNVGFFGDSFTENLRLPGEHGFVEVLDYLLNRHPGDFNAVNLGVDGYGTDQSYLYYREFGHAAYLDHVVYVFCLNDLRNIYENGLYSYDPEQGLTVNPAAPSPWWVRPLSRLHTTYLVVEALQRIRAGGDPDSMGIEEYFRRRERRRAREGRSHDERAESVQQAAKRRGASDDFEHVVAVFQALLLSWQEGVEANGGKFYVVLLPRLQEHGARTLVPSTINVIDLYEEFSARVDDYDYQDWHFATDSHWNEAGNQLAATALVRSLEGAMNLPELSDAELEEAVQTYYGAFGGWMPSAPITQAHEVEPAEARAIRQRYGPKTPE